MKKHIKYLSGAALVASALMAGSSFVQAADTSIATVVKIAGIQWFNRMEEGVNQYAKDKNVNAFQVGPAQADPQGRKNLPFFLVNHSSLLRQTISFSPNLAAANK